MHFLKVYRQINPLMKENTNSGINLHISRTIFCIGGNNERSVFHIDRFFSLVGGVG